MVTIDAKQLFALLARAKLLAFIASLIASLLRTICANFLRATLAQRRAEEGSKATCWY